MVRLPISTPSSPKHPVGQHPRRLQVARRILVVDDNVDAAEMLAELLRASGHEVAVSHDPFAAIEVFEVFRPEVAILDIGLPDMDGYELASRVAETGALRDCRLIALTGYGQDRDRERAAEAGFAAHLTKPVKLDALLGAIAGSDPDRAS